MRSVVVAGSVEQPPTPLESSEGGSTRHQAVDMGLLDRRIRDCERLLLEVRFATSNPHSPMCRVGD